MTTTSCRSLHIKTVLPTYSTRVEALKEELKQYDIIEIAVDEDWRNCVCQAAFGTPAVRDMQEDGKGPPQEDTVPGALPQCGMDISTLEKSTDDLAAMTPSLVSLIQTTHLSLLYWFTANRTISWWRAKNIDLCFLKEALAAEVRKSLQVFVGQIFFWSAWTAWTFSKQESMLQGVLRLESIRSKNWIQVSWIFWQLPTATRWKISGGCRMGFEQQQLSVFWVAFRNFMLKLLLLQTRIWQEKLE